GGSAVYRDAVARLLAKAADLAKRAPRFAGWWLSTAEAWADGPREVAIVGSPGPARAALVDAVWAWPAPGRVLAVGTAADDGVALLSGRSGPVPQAWVCRDFQCELPTDNPERVAALLRGATE
ncbi:MAG: hypothetical protein ABI720_01920, partial [Actinomycetes bacterium]